MFEKEIRDRSEDVNEEIRLASEQAAAQERQLQSLERTQGGLFFQKLTKDSTEAREWRIQANERRSSKVASLEQTKLC